MNQTHQRAIRILIAMQVAVLEHADEQLCENKIINALDLANREWQKILRELRKQ